MLGVKQRWCSSCASLITTFITRPSYKGERLKPSIALNGKSITELRGVTCLMGSHGWHPPTQVNASAISPANQAGTRFTYPGRMEGWVDLGSLTAARPGIEPTTAWSQVRRPNRYATESPTQRCITLLACPSVCLSVCLVTRKQKNLEKSKLAYTFPRARVSRVPIFRWKGQRSRSPDVHNRSMFTYGRRRHRRIRCRLQTRPTPLLGLIYCRRLNIR